MKFPFEKHFLVCGGARCDDPKLGSERGEEIRAELKDLNRTMGRKPLVRVCAVSCLDLCDAGPNMVVWPEGIVFSRLDRRKARAAYHRIMGDPE
jgi:(2Fe-2S) ferredoxin